MEKLNAYRETMGDYAITIIENCDCYDLYYNSADNSDELRFMYGLPIEQQTLEFAFDLGFSSLDDYIDDDDI